MVTARRAVKAQEFTRDSFRDQASCIYNRKQCGLETRHLRTYSPTSGILRGQERRTGINGGQSLPVMRRIRYSNHVGLAGTRGHLHPVHSVPGIEPSNRGESASYGIAIQRKSGTPTSSVIKATVVWCVLDSIERSRKQSLGVVLAFFFRRCRRVE